MTLNNLISKEQLVCEYIEKRRSMADIAAEIGCSYYKISTLLSQYGIPPRSGNRPKKTGVLTEEILRKEYVENKRSTTDIGAQFGVGPNTVAYRLRQFGMRVRSNSEVRISDIEGQKFGKFTAVKQAGHTKAGAVIWECVCECGNVRNVVQVSLTNGRRTKCKECLYREKVTRDEIPACYWSQIIKSAESRNIDFNLNRKEMFDLFEKQKRKCAISGLAIGFAESAIEHGHGFTTASVDRIDNDESYVLANVQWVHKSINKMRGRLTVGDFIELCQAVAQTQTQKAPKEL